MSSEENLRDLAVVIGINQCRKWIQSISKNS